MIFIIIIVGDVSCIQFLIFFHPSDNKECYILYNDTANENRQGGDGVVCLKDTQNINKMKSECECEEK